MPWRRGPALLFCPGDRPEMFDKAIAAADCVVLDLEDAVGSTAKIKARALVAEFARDHLETVVIRINARNTEWWQDDVDTVRSIGASVMVPKAESPEDLEGFKPGSAIALCETSRSMLRLEALASSPACGALMWGGEDLLADLAGIRNRGESGRYLPLFTHVQTTVRLSAAAAGKDAIDAINTDIADLQLVHEEAEYARDVGFTAKACIHPSHAAQIRSAFRSSTVGNVRWAEHVIELARTNDGVFSFEGMMIDGPLVERAKAILRQGRAE